MLSWYIYISTPSYLGKICYYLLNARNALKAYYFCMEYKDGDINLYANINGGLCGFSYVVIQLKHFL